MAKIGFVGLGNMGLPMAINLVKSGHYVTGYDLQDEAKSKFIKASGHIAENLQDAGRSQDVIITMLQTGEQAKKVYLSADGLLAIAKPDTLIIDCSSIDVPNSRLIHAAAEKLNLIAVDAPVSGGVLGAEQAKLTFMVGGTKDAFSRAEVILSDLAKKIIHTGDASSGQAAKICNNMLLGISMIGVCEAFTLAEHLGLTPQKLHEVVTNSSGQCWSMSNYVPLPNILEDVPANNNYKPGFTAAMMLKDLKLSQDSATTVGVETPLGKHAAEIYQQFNELGFGELDFSAIIKSIA